MTPTTKMMRMAGAAEHALLQKYGTRNVPRYTSYPTAPHFHEDINAEVYKQWLGALGARDSLSLYLHVPFCKQLCWYCGCAMQVARKYGPVSEYARVLEREIETVADHIRQPGTVRHIHWGGGSPNRLNAHDFSSLMAVLRNRFPVAEDAEIAIEIDPRSLDDSLVEAYALAGITRASLGLQDFTPAVQAAINREQPFELVADRVGALRAAGINALNFDLMYGLPHQGVSDAVRSVKLALTLEPSRVAVFGYAHVPWMRKHQNLIPTEALPSPEVRRDQAEAMAEILLSAGYVQIGIDHFARPGDSMAEAAEAGTLKRNFQGYTTDAASALIGFGASSIGALPGGYVQNIADTRLYEESVRETGLAVTRGIAVSADDRLRRQIIEGLMCGDAVDVASLCADAGIDVSALFDDATPLKEMQTDGLINWNGKILEINSPGRPYVRVVAAFFDAYLQTGKARHSGAV
ncbi:oxygen-independent coproporphyrinogen III oxidase [Nisaea nitritireducens]|uniref:oxygen-independent coproporphyrinogen III oxidase n=1 Tax=Nisaea nitritireducens TaxID=568392 RepID=UPI0029C018D1|nr:oxygen-independent coproporphyrinogen III oxidase [Nisaea nitritireducens]